MRFETGETMLECPPDTAGAGPLPAIIFLHGIGERGSGVADLPAAARWGLPKLRWQGAPLTATPFPYLVLVPQCPPDRQWSDETMQAALDALAERLIAQGRIDPDRLYLTGFSMGGIGTFAWAVRRPQRFAAIAPVCGLCETPERLDRLAALPAWIAYAEDDEIARLATGSRDAAAALVPFGNTVVRPYRLGAADGVGAHPRTADAAYADPELYTWMQTHRRDATPS